MLRYVNKDVSKSFDDVVVNTVSENYNENSIKLISKINQVDFIVKIMTNSVNINKIDPELLKSINSYISSARQKSPIADEILMSFILTMKDILKNVVDDKINLSNRTGDKMDIFLQCALNLNLRFGSQYKEIYLIRYGQEIEPVFSDRVLTNEVFRSHQKTLFVELYHKKELEAYFNKYPNERFIPSNIDFNLVHQDFETLDDLAGFKIIEESKDGTIKEYIKHIDYLFSSDYKTLLKDKIAKANKLSPHKAWFKEMLIKWVKTKFIARKYRDCTRDDKEDRLTTMFNMLDKTEIRKGEIA